MQVHWAWDCIHADKKPPSFRPLHASSFYGSAMKDTLVLMAFATLLNERGRGKVDKPKSDACYSSGGGEGGAASYFPFFMG